MNLNFELVFEHSSDSFLGQLQKKVDNKLQNLKKKLKKIATLLMKRHQHISINERSNVPVPSVSNDDFSQFRINIAFNLKWFIPLKNVGLSAVK